MQPSPEIIGTWLVWGPEKLKVAEVDCIASPLAAGSLWEGQPPGHARLFTGQKLTPGPMLPHLSVSIGGLERCVRLMAQERWLTCHHAVGRKLPVPGGGPHVSSPCLPSVCNVRSIRSLASWVN